MQTITQVLPLRSYRAHLVPQQLLRRELGVEGRRAAEDERSWVWCCGGAMAS